MEVKPVTQRGTWLVKDDAVESMKPFVGLVVEVAPPNTYVCTGCCSDNCDHVQEVIKTFTQPESFDE